MSFFSLQYWRNNGTFSAYLLSTPLFLILAIELKFQNNYEWYLNAKLKMLAIYVILQDSTSERFGLAHGRILLRRCIRALHMVELVAYLWLVYKTDLYFPAVLTNKNILVNKMPVNADCGVNWQKQGVYIRS